MGFNSKSYHEDDCENYIYDSEIDYFMVLLGLFVLFAMLCLVLQYTSVTMTRSKK